MDRECNGINRTHGLSRIAFFTDVILRRSISIIPTLKVSEILEVALYVTDLAAAEQFYTKILGLSLYSRLGERHVFLRCGDRMVLLFNAEETVHSGDGSLDAPAHGMKGAGHIAFAVRDCEIDQWKEYLTTQRISIEKEICWEKGRSLYFRDPSGNSVEITSPAIWRIEENMFFSRR